MELSTVALKILKMKINSNLPRCSWATNSDNMAAYHDNEWGVPSRDDRHLFEMLVLEGAQAGLSWQTILNRRVGYAKAFHNFDVEKVASMTDDELLKLREDTEIIRNRLKIESTRKNAKAFLEVAKEFGSFSDYLWSWVDNEPVRRLDDIWRATTPLSDAISKDLKKRGFSFVGSTIIYSYLQATGVVNDHELSCYRGKNYSQENK